MKPTLKLCYIPSEYWNEPLSEFKLIDNEKLLPKDGHFFLVWTSTNGSEEELVKQINYVFPTIPVNKLRTSKINLAFPSNEKFFKIKSVLGKIIPIPPTIKLLYRLNIVEDFDRGYSDSVKTYAFLTKLIFEILTRGSFVPILKPFTEQKFLGKWRLLLKTQEDNDRFNIIVKKSSWMAYNLPINFLLDKKSNSYKSDGLWHPSYFFSNYLDRIGDFLIRFTLNKSNFQTFQQFYSNEFKKQTDPDYDLPWDFKFLKSLIDKDPSFPITRFHETILPKIIKNWVQITQGLSYKQGVSFVLELDYPEKPDQAWPLKFLLHFQEIGLVSLKNFWSGKFKQKKEVMLYLGSGEELIEIPLRALSTASKLFPPIKRALESKAPYQIMLSSSEVIEFLKYPKDLLIQSGFNIILPDVFTKGGRQRLSARLIIRSKGKTKLKSDTAKLPSIFDINTMLEYKWEAELQGQTLTETEFKNLIRTNEPLINWHGEWILIDQHDINELHSVFEKSMDTGTKNYMEALKLGLTGNIQLEENGTSYEVVVEGDLKELIERIRTIEHFKTIPCPKSFNGILRPYQLKALTWMGNMCMFNFGLCLADDMGLGKTIQVIAFLLHLKENYPDEPGSILIICPTSVLFNWSREIKKFAPDLEILIHHGPDRYKDASNIPEFLVPHRIFLTTYGTLRNDIEFLETISFNGIIVDEIQNIKNYNSKQTKAVYKLQGNYKIGLSGTPIENRLMELWTLFEFLNPGLLGNRTEFQENFIIPIERYQDQDSIEKLRKLIFPFLLRRLKTDKSVIKDLPEKNEMKIYVELSEIQAKMYREVIEETLKDLESLISDKMNVLTLLVKLKQICNHPYQYLKKTIPSFKNGIKIKDFIDESYKLERLIEMVDEVMSNREKALIFTQFKQMGDIIYEIFKKKYDFDILYFHGGVPEKKRRELVDDFQSNKIDSAPVMILSLKAGGTGLNLTQATTVFHYDRWWNPAVEDQATDRAYRIGQKSPVNVYKFITKGTIEEKIDILLEEKRDLVDKIVSSS
ncbi:MAG: DEAD/DEAH box helicase, partial [Promethearchaeota archaeon]